MAFTDVIWDINTVLYGITAGIAILMITLYGIKWKIAENPEAREEAKRGILNVIFGLAIIIVAANLVALIFGRGAPGPLPMTTTTTPSILVTTPPSHVTTTTTTFIGTSTTTTPGGTTTTTFLAITECPETCINNNYLGGWACKSSCDPEPKEYDMGQRDCPSGKICCCKQITTTTTTTSTTTTTIPKACTISPPDPHCNKDKAELTCTNTGNDPDLCKGVNILCGAGYAKDCCCAGWGICC